MSIVVMISFTVVNDRLSGQACRSITDTITIILARIITVACIITTTVVRSSSSISFITCNTTLSSSGKKALTRHTLPLTKTARRHQRLLPHREPSTLSHEESTHTVLAGLHTAAEATAESGALAGSR